MHLPDFNYYQPETLQEACEILGRYGAKAKVLAGGTDLLPKMKQDVLAPEALVSLKMVSGMSDIEKVPGRGVVIGAKTSPNDLVNSSVLHENFMSVSEAAHSMANNQVRNMGTIAGNIVNAIPSADLPPILIALSATVTLVGPVGSRTLVLEDFITGVSRTAIAPDEIMEEVVIPEQSTTGSAYFKFGLRHSGALAVVGVAAAVTMQGSLVRDVRIVLGAVAPTPMRAKKAEEILRGKNVTDDLIAEAGKSAAVECKPISDIRASEEYRRDMVRVFTKRALRKAIYLEQSES
ncbi:MAG: xanthine dehydrogenase family protein subunit M [Deltaproteobacteria bacterium]|nr:xanthine dehydrogenase family protein subunit M [Deltaproteobacteria bacterium]